MKRRGMGLVLAALLLSLTLTACGGGSTLSSSGSTASNGGGWGELESNFEPSADMAAPEAAPAETESSLEYGSAINTTAQEDARQEDKIIYTGSLELETMDFQTASADLGHLVEELGGFIENSTSGDRGSGNSWAEYTVRVPAEQFQRFLDRAGELCHVTWQTSNRQNINEQYYDTAGRLRTQQIKLERLQALLEKAENMEDIITIESAISETEWMIDDYSGTLRHYDYQVDYATITVNLREVYRFSNVEETPVGFGGRMTNAFAGGLRFFGERMEDLAVALAYSWPWLLLLALFAAGFALVLRRLLRGPAPKRKQLPDSAPRQEESGDDKS